MSKGHALCMVALLVLSCCSALEQEDQSPPSPPPPASRSSRILAGLVAGTLSSVLLQPLEVVKTRMQTQHPGRPVWRVALTLLRDEGVRSLWAGTVAATVRLAGGIALYFVFLGEIETISKRTLGSLTGSMAILRDFLVGSVSRGLAAALFCPLAVVKTRQEEGVASAGGLVTQLVQLARTEGTAGCFAGLGPSLLRDAPYSGISLALLRVFRAPLLSLLPGALVGALAGCASAAAATVLTQPADVVHTEIVLQSLKDKRLGTLQAMGRIVSARGLGALFVGATPRLARRMLQQAMTWAVFETVVLGNR